MKSPRKFPFAGLMFASVLINLPGAPVALAQDASSWDAQPHTASRLIAGVASKNTTATFLHAGIEIKLDPGWRTYWRDPGDSGAPPTFDFSGSQNVKSVDVRWPAPERFPDGAGGNSIGYLDHVILPLRVVPQNAAKQTQLQVKLGYDICSNICIPVEADLKLPLGDDGAEEATIENAEIRVPRHVAVGQEPVKNAAAQDVSGESDHLAILAVRRQPGDAHDRVVVDVAAPAGATVNLFAEGPTPDWSLPLPEQTGAQGNVRQFSFDLDGLPPDVQAKGATLTLTAVSGDDAIEVAAHLD
ncbi:MAG: protein-disulfide reductase DsbD domain-containing protein [Xanthobacteraceae bacterium]